MSWTAELSDEELMLALKDGEDAAFDELLRRHQKPLFNFLYRTLGDRHAAEDLLQETFLRLLTKRHKYRVRGAFTSWLYQIARNLSIDYRRKAARRREISYFRKTVADDGNVVELKDILRDTKEGADTQAAQREIVEKMENALQRLPHDQREALVLKRYQDLSYQEIADRVGCSVSAAKMRVQRGHRRLVALMADVLDKGANSHVL